MATPLYVFWPCTAAWYPSERIASIGNRSSVTFSSCRQRTSGWCAPSQRRSLSSRARIELTFQVASFMSRLYPRTRRSCQSGKVDG